MNQEFGKEFRRLGRLIRKESGFDRFMESRWLIPFLYIILFASIAIALMSWGIIITNLAK